MSIDDVLESVRKKVNNYRALLYTMESKAFAIAHSAAGKEALENLDKIIESCDAGALKFWIKNQTHKHLGEMSILSLREKAKKLHIPYYYILSRTQLINQIGSKQDELARVSGGNENRDSGSRSQIGTIRPDSSIASGEIS